MSPASCRPFPQSARNVKIQAETLPHYRESGYCERNTLLY